MKVRSGQLLHHNFLNKFVFIPLPSLTDFFDSFPRLTLRRAFFSPSTTSPRFAVSLEHPYPDCRDCFVRFLRLSRLSLNEKIMRETCRSVPSRMWIAMIAGKAFPDVRLSRIQLHRIEIQSRTNRYRSREFGLQPRSSPIVGNYGTRKFLCEHSSNWQGTYFPAFANWVESLSMGDFSGTVLSGKWRAPVETERYWSDRRRNQLNDDYVLLIAVKMTVTGLQATKP